MRSLKGYRKMIFGGISLLAVIGLQFTGQLTELSLNGIVYILGITVTGNAVEHWQSKPLQT